MRDGTRVEQAISFALATLATLAVVSCGGDETPAVIDVVVLDVGPGLPEQPDSLRLEVAPLDSRDGASRSWTTMAAYDAARLRPWSTRVTPIGGDHVGRVLYRFRAIALRAGREVVRAQASLVFVPGTQLTLPLRLWSACVRRECADDQTCVDGTCVDDFVPACDLANGPLPEFCVSADAAVRDLGSLDARVDPVDAARDMAPGDLGAPDVGPVEVDAGPPDTGPRDTGPRDAGPADAGRDARVPDTGPIDAGCDEDTTCGDEISCACSGPCLACTSTCRDGDCNGTCTDARACSVRILDRTSNSTLVCEQEAVCAIEALGGDDVVVTCTTGASCSVFCRVGTDPDLCLVHCDPTAADCLLECEGGRRDCQLDCGADPATVCAGNVSVCRRPCPT